MIEHNWQDLIKPEKVTVEKTSKDNEAVLIAKPLERGYGLTLGTALRRILLSSLQGTALVGMKIEGVLHEFSSKVGMKEDIIEFMLNLKEVALKAHSIGQKKVSLKAKGPCAVTAGDIAEANGVEVINKDLVLCNLDGKGEIDIELFVDTQRGYKTSEELKVEDAPIGYIALDAIFSPVLNVAYKVESARVGQRTDFDELKLTVRTDGSLSPEDAVALASRIMTDQASMFINFEDPEAVAIEEEAEDELPFPKALLKKVDELELSVRADNCLKNDDILYLGDLVQKTENDMLKTPNFGRKSLNEIKSQLEEMGLHLGMKVEGWRPENIEELAKKYENPYS